MAPVFPSAVHNSQKTVTRKPVAAGTASNVRPYRECAEHVRQLEGESPFDNLMEVKS